VPLLSSASLVVAGCGSSAFARKFCGRPAL
jgi:hypothetical protein